MTYTDPSKETLAQKVKKQVEFYFSDSNLPRDKFLLEEMNRDPEKYVGLAILCTFSRMTNLLNLDSKLRAVDVKAEVVDQVASWLEDSDSLVLSEDRLKIKRAKPMSSPEEVTREVEARSIFAAPFPYDASLDALTAFFGRQGAVNSVRMRRHVTSKDFKGSVFVEFASAEVMQQVVDKGLVYEGAPLRLEKKVDYLKRKLQERTAHPPRAANGTATGANGTAIGTNGAAATKAPTTEAAAPADATATKPAPTEAVTAADGDDASEPAAKKTRVDESGAAGAAGDGPRGESAGGAAGKAGGTGEDGKAAAVDGAEAADGAAAAEAGAKDEEMADADRKTEEADGTGAASPAEAAPKPLEFIKGCVVGFAFADDANISEVSFPKVKEAFGGREAGIYYVEYRQGERSGALRFGNPEQAAAAMAAIPKAEDDEEGRVMVAGLPTRIHLMEGEEELAYQQRVDARRQEAGKNGGNSGGGRGFGRGGFGRGGGRFNRSARGGSFGRGRGRGQKRMRD